MTASQQQTESVGMVLFRHASLENDAPVALVDAIQYYDSMRGRKLNSLIGRIVIALVEHIALMYMQLREMKETLKIERQRKEAA